MPAYTTVAIVLRRLHYGETDNILTLYSPDKGRFSAIAKGRAEGDLAAVRRDRGPHLHPIRPGDRQVAGDRHAGGGAGVIRPSAAGPEPPRPRPVPGRPRGPRGRRPRPNPLLFDLLLAGLRHTQTLAPPELAARWFEVQLLGDLGYAPNLAECAVCQTPLPGDFPRDEVFALSASLGGALCPRHAHPESNEDHSGLGMGALRLLQTLENLGLEGGEALAALPAAGPKSMDQARLALRRSLRFRLERDLKSLEFLDSLRQM